MSGLYYLKWCLWSIKIISPTHSFPGNDTQPFQDCPCEFLNVSSEIVIINHSFVTLINILTKYVSIRQHIKCFVQKSNPAKAKPANSEYSTDLFEVKNRF